MRSLWTAEDADPCWPDGRATLKYDDETGLALLMVSEVSYQAAIYVSDSDLLVLRRLLNTLTFRKSARESASVFELGGRGGDSE